MVISSIKLKISLGFALCIASVLAITAFAKLLYPSEYLKTLDLWIGSFEGVFLAAILLFRKKWPLWVFSALVFALWSGYAFFWFRVKLPCGCMGSMLNIPTAFSIAVDVLFFSSCIGMGLLLGASRQWIYLSVLLGFILSMAGFAIAEWVYQGFVLKII